MRQLANIIQSVGDPPYQMPSIRNNIVQNGIKRKIGEETSNQRQSKVLPLLLFVCMKLYLSYMFCGEMKTAKFSIFRDSGLSP